MRTQALTFDLISGFHLMAIFKAEIKGCFNEKGRKTYNHCPNKSRSHANRANFGKRRNQLMDQISEEDQDNK